MQYRTIIRNLTGLLNQKGRSKKVAGGQENFIKLLSVLKNKFGVEISTTFLINLMDDTRTHCQKNQRVRDLCRGLEREQRTQQKRGSDIVKKDVEVVEYSYKKGYAQKKQHRNREVKTPKVEITKNGFAYINYRKQKELRDIGGFVCEGLGMNVEVKKENIGKEFMCSSTRTFNFIRV